MTSKMQQQPPHYPPQDQPPLYTATPPYPPCPSCPLPVHLDRDIEAEVEAEAASSTIRGSASRLGRRRRSGSFSSSSFSQRCSLEITSSASSSSTLTPCTILSGSPSASHHPYMLHMRSDDHDKNDDNDVDGDKKNEPSSSSSSVTCTPSATPSITDTLPECSTEWVRGVGFWRCFIAVCVPILLSAFEGSVVSTALPVISSALSLGPNSSWVATSFLLASIACQPLYGQLADVWGRRHLMMVAVVVFGAGSAVAGLATDGPMLMAGRVTQGLGSGGIDLFAELILCDIIPLQKRGHYVAIKAAVYALGTTIGPILGGVFAERNWRWCFGVNMPVCLGALVMMYFWLQVSNGSPDQPRKSVKEILRVDVVGILVLTTSVVFILFALSSGGAAYDWSSPIIVGTMTSGFAGVVLFALWERCRWCAHPIMSPHIFSNRTTIAAFVVTTAHGFITYGYQFYLPPFFQAVLSASPTESGVFILPCSLSIVVLAAVGGPLLSRFGRYRAMHLGGFGIMAFGLMLCTGIGSNSAGRWWIFFSFLVGIGSGIIVSTTLPAVLVELTDKDNAAATGSWAFLRGLGSLLGVAMPGAAFNMQFASSMKSFPDKTAIEALSHGRAYEHASAKYIATFDPLIGRQLVGIFSGSLMTVWAIFLAFAVVAMVVSGLERQVELRSDLDSDYGLKSSKCSQTSFEKGSFEGDTENEGENKR